MWRAQIAVVRLGRTPAASGAEKSIAVIQSRIYLMCVLHAPIDVRVGRERPHCIGAG